MEIPTVDIKSTKFIKPSAPTPATHRHHKMGFKDEVVATINVRLILFYSAVKGGPHSTIIRLENSLAQCLSRLHPIAGRYNHQIRAIECNDQGAKFIQAQVQNNIKLQDVLDPKVNPKILNNLLPCGVCDAGEITDPLLAVQATVFNCGGLSLGVSISHKVADVATLSRGFMDYNPPLPGTVKHKFENNYQTKRLSFSEEAISLIRAKINNNIQSYSRVQVVSTIIWKTLIDMDRAKHGSPQASILHQPVNIRGKTTPPIPNNACGNLGGFIITECSPAQTLMGFESLADLLHDSIKKTVQELGNLTAKCEQLQALVFNSFVKSETCDHELVSVFPFTSWCKFPFYQVDFGFGRPVWVASSAGPVSMVTLMDGRGGCGIDAYVNLDAQDMRLFTEQLITCVT
ncbi:pelargonidin 3-O-(6-caffeoylglucoside) 5-O-(6-O-malonylglucoside) 4'''-malonyltransferase-like [Bidens hawaiensis]|uniref:pelargonidin 3-O-(6-caffeoylglucoside) 5-O-(6-O-malonylglucoside) 4'''-malonyltransferase-like n=1 Tax=Bidens hawaiensis TaxID=980011 RepID=UPI004049D38E